MQSTEFLEFQEIEEGGGGLDTGTTVNRPNMPRLNNVFSTTANTTLKRRSPSSSSLQEPPLSKKRPLQPSSDSEASDHHLHGFTKLPLPSTSPIIGSPPSPSTSIPRPFLGRSLSYPISSPETNNLGIYSNPQSPEINNGSAIKALQPNLRRSVSDPLHLPPSSRDTGLNSKRLKNMKERMRDMNQWWNEILQEEEEKANTTTPPKDEESENYKTEEAVSVEKTGECLIIQFKCPCTKCYQILLSGNNCYYKLM